MAGPLQVKDFVDPETGEIRKFLIIEPKVKDKNFAKIRKALTETALKELKDLNGAVWLLLWFMDKAIEKKMFNKPAEIFVDLQEVCKELKVTDRTIKKYIKLLKDKGFIIQLVKRQRVYMLNPEYVWLGTAKSYVEYLKEKGQNLEKKVVSGNKKARVKCRVTDLNSQRGVYII